MKTEFKIVGITETTILDEEGKVVFDAGAVEHTALEDHERAKKVTKLFAAAPEMLEALIDAYMELFGGNSVSIQDALNRAPFNTTPLDFKMITAIKKATES